MSEKHVIVKETSYKVTVGSDASFKLTQRSPETYQISFGGVVSGGGAIGLPGGGVTNAALLKNTGDDFDASFKPLLTSYITDWATAALTLASVTANTGTFAYGAFSGAGMYLNYDGPDGDSGLYFYDGGIITGQSLQWIDGGPYFQFSADLNVQGGASATGTIEAGGNVRAGSDLYANYNGPEGDSAVYFYDGGVEAGQHLMWDNSPGVFVLSATLSLQGALVTTADVYLNAGGPEADSAVFFHDGGNDDGQYLKWVESSGRFEISSGLKSLSYVEAAANMYAATNVDAGGNMHINTLGDGAGGGDTGYLFFGGNDVGGTFRTNAAYIRYDGSKNFGLGKFYFNTNVESNGFVYGRNNLIAGADLYLRYEDDASNPDPEVAIYFRDGGDNEGKSLKWAPTGAYSGQHFLFDDEVGSASHFLAFGSGNFYSITPQYTETYSSYAMAPRITRKKASVSTTGWKRIGYRVGEVGRGGGTLHLTTGGNSDATRWTQISFAKGWSDTTNGGNGFTIIDHGQQASQRWTKVRLVNNGLSGGSYIGYLEVYFAGVLGQDSPSNFWLTFEMDPLACSSSTQWTMYDGELPDADPADTVVGEEIDINEAAMTLAWGRFKVNHWGSIYSKSYNMYLNSDGDDADTTLYFGDGGIGSAHWLRHQNSPEQFVLSSTLDVQGSLQSSGSITSTAGSISANVDLDAGGDANITGTVYAGAKVETQYLNLYSNGATNSQELRWVSGADGNSRFRLAFESDVEGKLRLYGRPDTGAYNYYAMVWDANTDRVSINKATPEYTLDVVGDINTSTALRIGGGQSISWLTDTFSFSHQITVTGDGTFTGNGAFTGSLTAGSLVSDQISAGDELIIGQSGMAADPVLKFYQSGSAGSEVYGTLTFDMDWDDPSYVPDGKFVFSSVAQFNGPVYFDEEIKIGYAGGGIWAETSTPGVYDTGDDGQVLTKVGTKVGWRTPSLGTTLLNMDITENAIDALEFTTAGGLLFNNKALGTGIEWRPTTGASAYIRANSSGGSALDFVTETADFSNTVIVNGQLDARGGLSIDAATPLLFGLDAGSSGQVVTSNGSVASWQNLPDFVTGSGLPTDGEIVVWDGADPNSIKAQSFVITSQSITSSSGIGAATLAATGNSSTGGTHTAENLVVNSNATIGDASSDALTVNAETTFHADRIYIHKDTKFWFFDDTTSESGTEGDVLMIHNYGGGVTGMKWTNPDTIGTAGLFNNVQITDANRQALEFTSYAGGISFTDNFVTPGYHTIGYGGDVYYGVKVDSSLIISGKAPDFTPTIQLGDQNEAVSSNIHFWSSLGDYEIRFESDTALHFSGLANFEYKQIKLGYDDVTPGVWGVGGGRIYFGDSHQIYHDNSISPQPPDSGLDQKFVMTDGLTVNGAIEAGGTIWVGAGGSNTQIYFGAPEPEYLPDPDTIPTFFYSYVNQRFEANRPFYVDNVVNYTDAAGVTVENVLIKDGSIDILDTHIALSNPHGTTKSDVGLGNVTNDLQIRNAASSFSTDFSSGTPLGTHLILAEAASGGTLEYCALADLPISDATQAKFDVYDDIISDTKEPTGFPNRTDSALSQKSSTRALRIAPSGASFDVWVQGTKFTKTSMESASVTDTDGLWYLYYDATGTLQVTQTFTGDLAASVALVCVAYWNASGNVFTYVGDERHGMRMDGATHSYLHLTRHTAVESGLGLGDITADGNGTLDAHMQLSTASGVIWDEDIKIDITGAASPAQIPIFYLTGATGVWGNPVTSNFPVNYVPLSRPSYNEWTGATWTQTEIPNNDYSLTHIFATNDSDQPYIGIQGQAVYNTAKEARVGATTEIQSLYTNGLPVAEFVAVGTIIFKASDTYTNTTKSAIITDEGGNDYISWVGVPLSPGTGPSNHNNLLNIGTNTHDEIDTHITAAAAHLALTDEHIDWTNATSDLLTTGSVECDEVILTDGIAMHKVITPGDMHSTQNWATPWSVSGSTTAIYGHIQTSIATGPAEWCTAYFQIPKNWKTGTAITVDLGFGISFSSPLACTVNITFYAVGHSFNVSGGGDESNYLGRQYSSSRGKTWSETDVDAYSQTFVVKEGISITTDGTINSNALSPGDQLMIRWGYETGTTNGTSATQAQNAFLRVNYTATDLTCN